MNTLALGLAPLSWLLGRDSPEACGIQPDEPEGAAPHTDATAPVPSASLLDA